MLSVLTRNNDEKPSFSLRTNSVLSGADVLASIFPEILILNIWVYNVIIQFKFKTHQLSWNINWIKFRMELLIVHLVRWINKYQLVQIQNGIANCAPCKVEKIENVALTNAVTLEPPENIRLWLAIWLLDYHNYNGRRIIREAKKDGKIEENFLNNGGGSRIPKFFVFFWKPFFVLKHPKVLWNIWYIWRELLYRTISWCYDSKKILWIHSVLGLLGL